MSENPHLAKQARLLIKREGGDTLMVQDLAPDEMFWITAGYGEMEVSVYITHEHARNLALFLLERLTVRWDDSTDEYDLHNA